MIDNDNIMRLKQFVNFGLLEIGQRIWLRYWQPEYEIHVRLDPLMPPDNNIVFEVSYQGQLFSSNNLDLLVKRFQANGFKLEQYPLSLSHFYIDEKRTKSLVTLKRIITRIVAKEYHIRKLGQYKNGWFITMYKWPDDLEFVRSELKSILGINVVEFILMSSEKTTMAVKL